MVEKFLSDLFRVRRKQKVAVIIDGGIVSQKLLITLSSLIDKIREIGEIKIAEVISEVKISEQDYKYLSQAGFTDRVVPGNLELNLLLETYDMVLTDKSIDIVVLGTHRSSLIPLYTELRKQVTIFAFVTDSHLPKEFIECFDGIIKLDGIDEFYFNASDFSEFESISSVSNGVVSDYVGEVEDTENDANIGIISDDLIEQSDLDESKKETITGTDIKKEAKKEVKEKVKKTKKAATKKKDKEVPKNEIKKVTKKTKDMEEAAVKSPAKTNKKTKKAKKTTKKKVKK